MPKDCTGGKHEIIQIFFKVCAIPSALCSLITKFGLLGFFKLLCARISLESNERVSVPVLLKRCFNTFLDIPESWLRNISRHVWIGRFKELVVLLLHSLGMATLSKSKEMVMFFYATAEFAQDVLAAVESKSAIAANHVTRLLGMLAILENDTKITESIPIPASNSLDIDSLAVSHPLSRELYAAFRKATFRLIVHTKVNTNTKELGLLFQWSSQYYSSAVVDDQLLWLRWILATGMDSSSAISEWDLDDNIKETINWIVLNGLDASCDEVAQLCRAILVLDLRRVGVQNGSGITH